MTVTNRTLRLLDIASLVSFAAVWVALARRAAASPSLCGVGPQVLAPMVGYVLADFASGVMHWLGDRFFNEATPVFGPAIIRPFREHHRDPLALTRHGLLELSGNSALACIPFLTAWIGVAKVSPNCTIVHFVSLVLLWGALATLVTNHAHKWAHLERVPAAVRWLQRHHLLLSPAHHARHHAERHDRAYCVTTGWLNPILDGLKFFGCLEWMALSAAALGRGLWKSAPLDGAQEQR